MVDQRDHRPELVTLLPSSTSAQKFKCDNECLSEKANRLLIVDEHTPALQMVNMCDHSYWQLEIVFHLSTRQLKAIWAHLK